MRPPALVCASLVACALLACVRDDCEGGHRLFGGRCLDLAAGVTTRWGFAPDTIRVADLDGDGARDVIAASHANGAVAVVWGGSDMFPGTATIWSVAGAIDGLAVADLDDDGRLDLVTAAPEDHAVAVLRGRGGRELAPAELHPTALAEPTGVLALDLDGQGAPELVTIHRADDSLAVLHDLEPAATTPVGPGPRDLAAGDLDGDGDLDLAVALTEAAAVQIVLGDGAGGLELGPRHPVGLAPFAVVAADLDRDGALDLATADALSDQVTALYGDGAGRLRARVEWPTDPEPRDLAVVDEGDSGHVLYVMSYQTSTIQRLDPRRGVDLTGATRERVSALATGDLDGDGDDDLVYASSAAAELGRVAAGPGFTLAPKWQTVPARRALAIDRDGDGVDEIAVFPADTADAVIDPERTAALQLWRDGVPDLEVLDLAPLRSVGSVLAGEFDDRPGRELVAWNSNELAVYTQADGELTPSEPLSFPFINAVLLRDGDGDGEPELIVVRVQDQRTLLDRVVLDDDGVLVVADSLQLDQIVERLTAIDHDGDGDDALIGIARNQIRLYDGDAEPRSFDLDGVGYIDALAFADLEGDGRRDAAMCTSVGLLLVGDVFGSTPGEPQRLDRGRCREVSVHDLDGDGRLDLLAERGDAAGSSQRAILTPWLRGDDGWTRLASQSVPAPSSRAALVHLDDDPWPDLLVDEFEQPARIIDLSFGPSIGDEPLFTADVGYRFVDLDGDGVLDLLGVGRALALAPGDGAGGFGPVQQRSLDVVIPGADQIWSAAVDDFDHDGDVEMYAVAQRREGWRSDLVRVDLDRNGDTTATPLAELPRIFTLLALADFDGDRIADLLASAGVPDPQYALLRGRPDGSFVPGDWRPIELESTAPAMRPVDLDGDGRLDLVEPRVLGVMFHRGLGDGAFAPPQRWSQLRYPVIAGFADIDRDGRRDLTALAPGGLVLARGQADGGSHPPQTIFADAGAGALADLDDDGQLEILAGTGDALHIGHRDGDGRFLFTRHDLAPATVGSIQVADFDGDGLLDLGLRNGASITLVRQTP